MPPATTTGEHRVLAMRGLQAQRPATAADRFLGLLASRNSLEAYLSLYSIAWALGFGLDPTFLKRPHMAGLAEILAGNPWFLSAPLIAFGVLGLWALGTKRRNVRAHCACATASIWLGLAIYFVLIVPPIWPGLANFASAALAEAWVFVRVSARMDTLAHVGFIERGNRRSS